MKNKRLKITLNQITDELLSSLEKRLNKTKSIIIQEALVVYSTKLQHNCTILFRVPSQEKETIYTVENKEPKKEKISNEEFKEILNDLEKLKNKVNTTQKR